MSDWLLHEGLSSQRWIPNALTPSTLLSARIATRESFRAEATHFAKHFAHFQPW